MSRHELRLEFERILRDDKLSVNAASKDQHLAILKLAEEAKQGRVAGASALDSEALDAGAEDLARFGSALNMRLQKLVPSVLSAATACFARSMGPGGVPVAVPTEDDIFFGELPTTYFNAQAVGTPHGHLVLLDTGVLQIISEFGRLQSAARQTFVGRLPANDAIDGAARYGAALAWKYLNQWSFTVVNDAGVQPEETQDDLLLNDFTLQGVIVFVVAHELGHVMLRHCYAPSQWGLFFDGEPTPALSKPWLAELSADAVALHILVRWCGEEIHAGRVHAQIANAWLAQTLSAPLFFFDCERLISAAATQAWTEREEDGATHPPAVLRQAAIMRFYKRRPEVRRFLDMGRTHRTFLGKVRRTLDGWRAAGTLAQCVSVKGGGVDEFKNFLLSTAISLGYKPE